MILGVGWSLAVTPWVARSDTFYVDSGNASCSSSGPGTQSAPYCAISDAVGDHSGPGITIIVMPGTYSEAVDVTSSGAAGAPFVIQAQGPGVVLDGADDYSDPSQWAPYSGSVFLQDSVTYQPSQVFVDGARLRDTTGTSPGLIPPGSFAWVSGHGIYVNIGGDNPGTHTTLVGDQTYGFTLWGTSYVTIQGFHMTHFEDRGVDLMAGSNHCTILGNRVDFCFGEGVHAGGCTADLIAGNTVVDNYNSGIALTDSATGCTIQDNECARNTVPDVFHDGSGVYLYGAPNNLIQRNRLHENNDEGLNLLVGANNNLSIQNIAWGNADHGFDELSATGNVHIGDVAWRNAYDGFAVDGNATGTVLYDCIATDNGLSTGKFDLWVDSSSKVGWVSDYNMFWNSTPQAPIRYINTKYTSVAAYSAASGQDMHTLQADPRFANAAAGNFNLVEGSPAIDSGISSVPNWPLTDAVGNPRVDDPATPNTGAGNPRYADRGALEFQTDQAPVVTAPAAASVNEGSPLALNITASDPDGNPITTLTATGLPAGATFTAGAGNTSGTLNWTPGYTQPGNYTVSFTAANALSGSASTTITVNFVDRPPVVTAPSVATVNEASLLTINVTASDPNGDALQSLTASGLPTGATFTPGTGNTAGTLSWTPGYTQAGTYTVTFSAANNLSGSATTTITVNNVDRPPVVTAPPAVSVNEGSPLAVNVTASDPDGDPITALTAAGLPAGATFTPGAGNTTGTLSWTPGYTQAGTYTVSFTAANALSGSVTTTITVNFVDQPPAVTAPPNVTVGEGSALTINVTASDPNGDAITALTADLSALPAGAKFTPGPGDTTGTLIWTPGYSDAGKYAVTFTAANALSGSATTAIIVNHLDRAPVVTAPPNANVNEGSPLTVSVTASDPDGDTITTLTADLSHLPPGAKFTAGPGDTTGTLIWTPGYSDAGKYAVTFTATNALSGSATTAIIVNNLDRAPVVTAPPNAIVDEGSPLTVSVTASDPDGDTITALTADLSHLPAGAKFTAGPGDTTGTLIWTPGYSDAGKYAVTFTAANALSGSATTAIIVNHVDRAPVVTAPDTVAVNAGASLTVNVVAADPNGDAITSLTATGLPAGATFTVGTNDVNGTLSWTPGYAQAGTYRVTFTAANALSDSTTTTILVSPSSVLAVGDGIPPGMVPLVPRFSPSPVRSYGELMFLTTRAGPLEVAVYDLAGRRVRELMNDASAPAGLHRLPVRTAGDEGGPLPSGIYFVRVRAAEGIGRGRFAVTR
jgi:parallel beta-helix repeat protein